MVFGNPHTGGLCGDASHLLRAWMAFKDLAFPFWQFLLWPVIWRANS